ncbi:MAG: 4-hydroxythreonine-4-phosphate dehydrogenase PdxA [Candidatus Omnitrophica bacterium]|nr:4-hydroxythreonine-4-phosphate dehydrogenase PdxA [Candidatus Omnitrophota bacterium]
MRTSPSGKAARRAGGKPVICISVGDPRGIGPEVTKKAVESKSLRGRADFLIIGKAPPRYANPRDCAKASIEFINTAFELIMSKKADALVTGPVSKEAINKAGVKFDGHTEYLAKLCKCKKFVMMFISSRLKVSLVTRHMALREVANSISQKAIYDTVELTYKALKNWFGIRNPKIGVSGLNPHCGEGGLFGREEGSIIKPAIEKLKEDFKGIFGPLPADTLLHDVYHKKFDAAVCMYHDQALAAFKMVAMETGVNLTLGLPFIRTSVDHGTAFDIAGKNCADPSSMIEAIKLAIRLVRHADNYPD